MSTIFSKIFFAWPCAFTRLQCLQCQTDTHTQTDWCLGDWASKSFTGIDQLPHQWCCEKQLQKPDATTAQQKCLCVPRAPLHFFPFQLLATMPSIGPETILLLQQFYHSDSVFQNFLFPPSEKVIDRFRKLAAVMSVRSHFLQHFSFAATLSGKSVPA